MKTKILIILIVVILLTAGGVGYYFYLFRDEALRGKTSQEQKTADACEKITNSVERDNCYLEVAIKTRDSSLCGKITDSSEKDECVKFFRREAKKLINEALLKIEKVKTEEDIQKLQLLISEAVEYGKKATEFDPENPEILFQMGNIYFEIKEIVSGADVWARYYYEKVLELDPNNPVYQEKLREIQSQQ